ncbi:MAG: hypothetical protein IKZ58_05720 [Selenomonadaceae bacterium]|nr:hypothetical protein [Selenomonadaceae bacterium]
MNFKGYSGCKLKLIEDEQKNYVKKLSVSKDYNSRLESQCLKQSAVFLNGFNKCNIYDSGFQDGLFYFTMEYVQGKTLAEKMFDINLYEIEFFTYKLLLHATNYEKINFGADSIFQAKIEDLQKKLFNRVKLNEIFNILKNFSWQYVIHSKCHGDLTLENIIVSGEKLTPIDFLDSFYDSWMIDAAKILQDVDVMWSYRHILPNSNLLVRLTIMRDFIVQKIRHMFMGDKMIETVYMILLLNLIRIFPYVKDSFTENFLSVKIPYIVDKIKNHKWED